MTRVYMTGSAVAHLLPWSASANDSGESLCGRSPWPGYWFGTGSQDEYEKANTLPLCMGCASKIRR